MKTAFKILATLFVLLLLVYLLGPAPERPAYATRIPEIPAPNQVEKYVAEKEGKFTIKPGNAAEIVWADSTTKKQTPYVVVYLHGFGASHEEGNPAARDFAKKYHFNLYLSRLAEHGLVSKEPMLHMTAENLWESAVEAYAIGRRLGKKVILMSTSNGGTLSLKLAAEFPEINSLILYSPNIKIRNDQARLLNNHWGLQVARYFSGSDYVTSKNKTPEYAKFWYPRYRLEATVQLEELVETSMNKSTFNKVKQPVLLLYYYKDENHQDKVVSVAAMLKMFDELGTRNSLKRKVAIPNAGDHVIGSSIRSKDVAGVERETVRFAEEVLKLNRPG